MPLNCLSHAENVRFLPRRGYANAFPRLAAAPTPDRQTPDDQSRA